MFVSRLSTPIGELTLIASDTALTGVDFPSWRHRPARARRDTMSEVLGRAKDQLTEYFTGTRTTFDIPLDAAATHGKHQYRITRLQPAGFQPSSKHRGPAFIVDPRGQFGNVVGWRISFDSSQLAEIVHGVRRVSRAAPDTDDEQPPAALANIREKGSHSLDRVGIEPPGYFGHFGQKRS